MLDEGTKNTVTAMLAGLGKLPESDELADRRPATNTFSGSQNVNIVCQTLVIGSLQELVDVINKKGHLSK